MKIIKSRDMILKRENDRITANRGCNICPGCGNTKILDIFRDIDDPKTDEIIKTTFHVTQERLFTYKSGSVDHYKCNKCGTEWESEIY